MPLTSIQKPQVRCFRSPEKTCPISSWSKWVQPKEFTTATPHLASWQCGTPGTQGLHCALLESHVMRMLLNFAVQGLDQGLELTELTCGLQYLVPCNG